MKKLVLCLSLVLIALPSEAGVCELLLSPNVILQNLRDHLSSPLWSHKIDELKPIRPTYGKYKWGVQDSIDLAMRDPMIRGLEQQNQDQMIWDQETKSIIIRGTRKTSTGREIVDVDRHFNTRILLIFDPAGLVLDDLVGTILSNQIQSLLLTLYRESGGDFLPQIKGQKPFMGGVQVLVSNLQPNAINRRFLEALQAISDKRRRSEFDEGIVTALQPQNADEKLWLAQVNRTYSSP